VRESEQWNVEPTAAPLSSGRHAELVTHRLQAVADVVGLGVDVDHFEKMGDYDSEHNISCKK
jgi:hypothetical protein